MNNLWIKRLKTAVAVIAMLGLVSCGGGGGGGTTGLVSESVVISPSGGQSVINNAVVATYDAQFANASTQANVTIADAVVGNGEIATPVSRAVSVTVDVNAINTSENDAGITLYLPPSGTVAGVSAPASLSVLPRVVRTLIGGVYYYSAPVITDAQKTVSGGAIAAARYSKELVNAAGGKIEAVVLEIPVSTTDDGQLYEFTSSTSTQPAPANTAVFLQGKIPLVLVHGIQASCTTESSAYVNTWKSFSTFFYNDASAVALRQKYALYSFAYRTDLSIAHNGQRLNDEMLRVFGTTKVVVLAHSMGGLVARYVDASTSAGLAGLITLNTPHHGTKTVNYLSPIISSLSKATYLALIGWEMKNEGAAYFSLPKENFQTSCFMAGDVAGALDMNWDSFDNIDQTQRCTSTSNSFLCDNTVGINKKPFKQPTRVYLYSSYLGDDLKFAQLTQIVSGELSFRFRPEIFHHDGDVPVASQQYQEYFDTTPNFRWRADVKTAVAYQNLDHVQIHDDNKVFTSGGIKGSGLVGDLIDLATPAITGFTPLTAAMNTATNFTVTGINLPNTIAVGMIEGHCNTPSNRSSIGFNVICTPGSVNGDKTITIKDAPGGNVIDANIIVSVTDGLTARGLFPTGVDAMGHALASGWADSHYTILSPNQPAAVVNADPAWIPNSSTSMWIWENPSGQPTNVTKTFRTTFELLVFNSSNSVAISGKWATDNYGRDILINGVSTGNTCSGYTSYCNFSVTSGFVAGINTLDFVVEDVGGIAGFRVDANSISILPAPLNPFTVSAIDTVGTTFTVPAGATSCTFNAPGTWNPGPSIGDVGAVGYGTAVAPYSYPLDTAATFSLVAKMQNGSYQYIGLTQTVAVNGGDAITFLMNDSVGGYADNSGALSVAWQCNTPTPIITSSCSSPVTNILFTEDFASPLSASKWNVDATGGTVTSGGGVVAVTGGSSNRFPYVESVSNPIPSVGNFSFYCKGKYTHVGSSGTGICDATEKIIPAGTAWWQFDGGSSIGWWSAYGSGVSTVSVNLGGVSYSSLISDNAVHEFETCVIGTTVTSYIDGVQVKTATLPSNWNRPAHVWFGNPVLGGSDWASFETNKIEVRQLQASASVAPMTGNFAVAASDTVGTVFNVPVGATSCTFNATGTWNWGGGLIGSDGNGKTDAAAVLPTASTFSLIARMPNGAYQYIGTTQTVSVSSGESIAFLMNDGNYSDNSASLSVAWYCN